MAISYIWSSLPRLIGAIILLLIGFGISAFVWFVLKKIIEFFKIDERIKFKFLNRDILIAFWFPILVVAPIFLTFLQSAIDVLVIRALSHFMVYLYYYFPLVLRLCLLIIAASTVYYYLVERKTKPKKKKK